MKKSIDVKYLIKVIVILFMMFLFGVVVPPFAGISQLGVTTIGILAAMIFALQTGFSLGATALMGMVALLVSGAYDAKTLIASTMGSTNIFQIMILFVLCGALNSSGAAEMIARKLVSSKLAKGRPGLFTIFMLLASAVAGMTIGSIPSAMLLFSIIDATADFIGYEKDSKWRKCMLICTLVISGAASAAFPFAGMAVAVFALLNVGFANAGIVVDLGSYMIASFSFEIVLIIVMYLIMKLLRVDFGRLKDFDPSDLKQGSGKLNKKQLILCIALVLMIIFCFITALGPADSALVKALTNLSLPWFIIIMICIMCLIKIDGEPIFSVGKDFAQGVKWEMILGAATFIILGGAIGNSEVGIQAFFTTTLNPLFGNMSFPVFMLAACLITIIITNFFNNAATGVLISTILAPFIVSYYTDLGVNASVVVAIVCLSAMTGHWTPAASATAPLLHGHEAFVNDRRFVWTQGMVFSIAYIILSAVWFTAFAFILK